jgi:phytoene dehydrogenase-like protein
VLSNAGLKNTTLGLVGRDALPPDYLGEVEKVRLNNSSCQVYMGIRTGESIPNIGDLVFTSDAPHLNSAELVDLHTSSRTFSLYYPATRPGRNRYAVVASINARYEDWAAMDEQEYQSQKRRIIDESIAVLERHIPGVRQKIDWVEAATPKTIKRFTSHAGGSSFGTKFEGLKVSMDLPRRVPGLYHVGSVGIIMSGWLGTINYGVIAANGIDKFLFRRKRGASTVQAAAGSDQTQRP